MKNIKRPGAAILLSAAHAGSAFVYDFSLEVETNVHVWYSGYSGVKHSLWLLVCAGVENRMTEVNLAD